MFGRPQNLLTNDLVARETPPPAGGGWFDLDDWVGPNHPCGRRDIARLEAILANSGDYSLERTQGPTGYWGLALDKGIRAYQQRNGLAVDGVLRPDGPTIRHMADAFGATLAGHSPPTPEDIDRHHEAVGTDAPDVIAWRKPGVDFSAVPGLPAVDQEADASNARLMRAMLRTGEIEGYAPLMKQAIDQGGKRALAEVADLAKKLDEAQPGLGGRFASTVTGHLTEEQIAALGIERPSAQPPGTVQTAQAFGDTGFAATLGLLGALGAAKRAADDTAKIVGTPGFTPADQPAKPADAPPPALVDVPIHTGGEAPVPGASGTVETLPAAQQARKEKFIGDLVDEVMPHIFEHHSGEFYGEEGEEKREDMRAGKRATQSNNIGAEALKEVIEESGCAELIKHTGGASENGEYQKYLKEKIVDTLTGPRRADLTAELVEDKTGIVSRMHINTVTTDALGNPIPREAAAGEAIANADGVGNERFGMIRKMREGEDRAEYKKEIKELMREKIRPILNDCQKFLDGFK